MLMLKDPLLYAGLVIVLGFIGSRYWQQRSLPAYYLLRVAVFICLTMLLLKGGVVPYRPRPTNGNELSQLFVAVLEIIWWLGAAWVAVGFFRAFLVWGRQPRESKLIQDLLAGLIYLLAIVAIIAYVFDLPVQGLLATSGAAAILIGLALQSSLGDVFSGVVLNLERPYRVGDWIIVDEVIQGEVIETNWRATHVLLGSHDIAVVPNSVIAKAKLINCSAPTPDHRVTLRVRLEPSISPETARRLLKEALLGSPLILKSPEPIVTIKDLSAETLDIELAFTVGSMASKDAAQNDAFEHVHRAIIAAGVRFAPRLPSLRVKRERLQSKEPEVKERLLSTVSLFSPLTTEEQASLIAHMQRRELEAGDLLHAAQALYIVSDGVVVASISENGQPREVGRYAPGDYFGEHGFLTGEESGAEFSALTRVVMYQISKDSIAPLLKARPSIAASLSEGLANRDKINLADMRSSSITHTHDERFTERLTQAIKSFFSIK